MRMFLLLFLLEMLQKYKLLPRVIILTLLLKLAKPLSRLSSCCISPLQIPICFIIANYLPKRNRSHPEHSGRLRSVHPFNACRPSAASTPPAPLSSLRSAPSASPHIPRAYAHTHSARAFCRRSMSGSIVHGLSKGQIHLFAFKIRCSLLDPQQSSLKWPALRSSRQ